MIDFTLTEEQKMLRQTVRDFAEKEIRPIATEMDAEPDPVKSFDIAWEVIKKGAQLGFYNILIPEKYGGMGGNLLDLAIVAEELAWGDAGIALSIMVNAAVPVYLVKLGTEEQKEKWLRPFCEDKTGTYCFCGSATEPTGGSEVICPLPDPALGTRTMAIRDGDDYIINGSKSFASFGTRARVAVIVTRTDRTKPNWDSCSRFIIPMDTPGLKVGRIENKMGCRGYENSDLFFENVRVPKENMIGEEGSVMTKAPPNLSAGSGVLVGALSIGLARAAYEAALNYASERKIWGKLLRDHELIGDKLVGMRMQIEASRALVWKVAWATLHPEESEGLYKLGDMAKVFPTSMVRGITNEALQIFGGYGYMRDYPVEKYVRDSMIMPIYEGTNEVHKIFLAKEL
ncbi:acyl-CoA dehydrogenase family protein [Chloroflexota bacterium]